MGNLLSQHEAQFESCVIRRKASITVLRSHVSPDTDSLFTGEEKQLIRNTWSQMQRQATVTDDGRIADNNHNVNRGVRVFLRIFELEPEAQSLFVDFQHVSLSSQLDANPVFRSHAKRFMTAVDMTVHSIEALDVIVAPTLVRLGRRHVQFAGFHPRYMVVFEQAMDSTWRTDLGRRRYSGATRRAWRKLFRFLTTRVTEGYNEALRELTPATDSLNVDTAAGSPSQSACTNYVVSIHKN